MKLIIPPPTKPFPNYKWRWATFQPTESLNDPPVFIGVLRVFNKFNNYAPGAKEILKALEIVKLETRSRVDLVRTRERNLVRNSGQYWKALGLLEEAHGKISVSSFGKSLAVGKITQVEFATTVVKTLELPNRRIVEDTSDWDKVALKIKPLELILNVIAKIAAKYGADKAFITPSELVKITIPLAGAKASVDDQAHAIILNRKGKIAISKWPDCAPSSNDKRMAREFLLFLYNYGFCNVIRKDKGNENEQYFLSSISKEEIAELEKVDIAEDDLYEIAKRISETRIPANVERNKVSREIIERPYQSIFRKNILSAYNSACIITGVSIDSVLEASHIVPVKDNGSDKIENGLCLRSDIHQLFDSGHLRLSPTGELISSEIASRKDNYGDLPKKIEIPKFVNKANLEWRINYY